MVKRLNSCGGILAVERLEREREAVLKVRFSGEGKAEVGVGGVGWLLVFWKDEMVTAVGRVVGMTGNLEHLARRGL